MFAWNENWGMDFYDFAFFFFLDFDCTFCD